MSRLYSNNLNERIITRPVQLDLFLYKQMDPQYIVHDFLQHTTNQILKKIGTTNCPIINCKLSIPKLEILIMFSTKRM